MRYTRVFTSVLLISALTACGDGPTPPPPIPDGTVQLQLTSMVTTVGKTVGFKITGTNVDLSTCQLTNAPTLFDVQTSDNTLLAKTEGQTQVAVKNCKDLNGKLISSSSFTVTINPFPKLLMDASAKTLMVGDTLRVPVQLTGAASVILPSNDELPNGEGIKEAVPGSITFDAVGNILKITTGSGLRAKDLQADGSYAHRFCFAPKGLDGVTVGDSLCFTLNYLLPDLNQAIGDQHIKIASPDTLVFGGTGGLVVGTAIHFVSDKPSFYTYPAIQDNSGGVPSWGIGHFVSPTEFVVIATVGGGPPTGTIAIAIRPTKAGNNVVGVFCKDLPYKNLDAQPAQAPPPWPTCAQLYKP